MIETCKRVFDHPDERPGIERRLTIVAVADAVVFLLFTAAFLPNAAMLARWQLQAGLDVVIVWFFGLLAIPVAGYGPPLARAWRAGTLRPWTGPAGTSSGSPAATAGRRT